MTDGEEIKQYMQDATSNVRSVGRKSIYAIIATSWAICFKEGVLTPTTPILWAFIFAIIYIIFDYLYFFITAFAYKKLLTNYFKPEDDKEFSYKKGSNKGKVEKISKYIMCFGAIVVRILFILLLLSLVSR